MIIAFLRATINIKRDLPILANLFFLILALNNSCYKVFFIL